MKKYDKIKNEYISTDKSIRILAEEFGISYSTLKDVAWEQKWTPQRKAYREKVQKKTEEKIAEKLSEKESTEVVDGIKFMDALLGALEREYKALKNDKPKVVQVQTEQEGTKTNTVRVEEESSLAKLSRIISDTTKIIETKNKYAPAEQNEYEDDGLLKALAGSVEDMEDDSDFLPEQEEG